MKKTIIFCASILMVLMSIVANANEEKERMYLIQLLNQLNAMKPLIIAASKEQPRMNRTKFHYMSYSDIHGKKQDGLADDINQIEQKIRVKLYQIPAEPRDVPAINDDYLLKQ
jgi:RAQPRD family integrative conjugative element protein